MKAIVIYDSVYGNTEKIAQCIADALKTHAEVELLRASTTRPEQLIGCQFLLVGSPTQQFRPIAPIREFLQHIPDNALKGVQVAAFDTRLTESNIAKIKVLDFFVKIFGYAAKPIADALLKKGGELVVPPEGFYVADTQGPLIDGELERAARWANQIVASSMAVA